MYLKQLNESQQKLFLNICYDLVISDNDFCAAERKRIREFEDETGLVIDLANIDKNMDRVTDKLATMCSDKEKRIIFYELVGLINVDNDFSNEEKVEIKRMIEKFDLSDDFRVLCEKKQQEFTIFRDSLDKMILSGEGVYTAD